TVFPEAPRTRRASSADRAGDVVPRALGCLGARSGGPLVTAVHTVRVGEGGSVTVAVIAPADDVAADRVTVDLRRRLVTVHRIDPADVPKLLTVTAALGEEGWAGVVKGPYRATSLRDVRAVYCRQPVVPRIGPLLDALDVRWV